MDRRRARRCEARRRARRRGRLGPALCASLALAGGARADVVNDGSLGAAGPVPFDGTTWRITEDLGRRSGGNLFHSFSLFDVAAGQTASFQPSAGAPPPPERVIARVTGGTPSQIDGRLQSLYPGADLYLLNPSGLSFGPSADVEALGSVAVSSADVLRFGSGPAFDARSAATPPALAVDAPTAFGFLSSAPAPIEFDLDRAGTPLEAPVPDGESFTAVGGDVSFSGWSGSLGSTPTLRIEGGNVAFAAVRAAGVDVPVDVASFDARGQAAGRLGSVSLGRNAVLDVGSPAGNAVGSGRVVIRAGHFEMDDARIDAVNGSGVAGAPSAVDVEVSEGARIRGGSRLTASSAAAAGGDLRLSGPSVEVAGAGTLVFASAGGAGEAPELRVDADSLHVGDGAQLVSRTTQTDPAQSGGRIALAARSAVVDGGAVVLSRSQGAATGGAIEVDGDALRVSGGAAIRSESTRDGRGGALDVDVRELRVESLGQLASENTSTGAGGAIAVNAREDALVSGRGKILSQATGVASGAGGDVTVTAGRLLSVTGEDTSAADVSQIAALTSSSSPDASGGALRVSAPTIELRDAGQLRTTTTGAGHGGTLTVSDTGVLRAQGNATVAGETAAAGLFARTTATDGAVAAGDGGSLAIEAGAVEILDGAEVSTRTLGSGDAGDLRIAADSVTVQGGPSGVSTVSTRGAEGAGGNLEIAAGALTLASGGIVSASTVGSGDAGQLHVAADRVEISDAPSGLFSQTTFGASTSGAAGDVVVEVGERLLVRDGGRVSVDSSGGGAAGDVRILGAPHALVAVIGGNVSAASRGSAAAGNVSIDAGRRFLVGRGGSVTTDAVGNASGGRVEVTARQLSYLDDASIETRVDAGAAGGLGNGGDVDLPGAGSPPPALTVLNRSAIVATTFDGVGGNIRVGAQDLIASQDAVIDPTALGGGVSGTVEITSPDSELAGQIVPLPANFLDAAKQMTTACDARRARTGSFVVQTRDAPPPPPDAPVAPGELEGGPAAARDAGAGDERCPG